MTQRWINVTDYPNQLLERFTNFLQTAIPPYRALTRKFRLNTHAQ